MLSYKVSVLTCCLALFLSPVQGASSAKYLAGVGRMDITPTAPVHLGGYAARTQPFKTVGQKIHVKALALGDSTNTLTLILTADTIGTPRWFNDSLAERIGAELGIPRARFLFACSHSHSTPAIKGALDNAYNLSGDAAQTVEHYSLQFLEKCFTAARSALSNMEPVSLLYSTAQAGIAVNRRQFQPSGVALGTNPTGLVDTTVPILRAERADGSIKALLFGYACHCTTLGATEEVSGDWAGYAQQCLEDAFPTATALFITGCGADANPGPRGQRVHVAQHGLALAGAVADGLTRKGSPISGAISTAFDRVELPLAPLPTREDFESRLTNSTAAVVRSGQHFLDLLKRDEKIPTTYPCPVQVVRFGDDLTLVALGGEVVVDYAYRLRRDLPGERIWPAGYCNDVFAYVPSLRVLNEGGYEADSSMIYYGLPTRFADSVEEVLVAKVLDLVRQAKRN